MPYAAPDDDTLVSRLNLLCIELLDRLAHKGSLERAAFTVSGGTFTLPWFFEGIVGFTFNKVPLRIFNQWWEILPLSVGKRDNVYSEAVDLGDGWVTFKDLADVEATGCFLKVISDVDEIASDMMLHAKGLDTAGEVLRTENEGNPDDWIDGEKIAINDTGTWSENKFTTLDQVIKPPTKGRIRLYASGTSGDVAATLVAIYQPQETDPSWRRYKIPVNSDGSAATVEALCQVRHQWACNDDEPLSIGNLAAIEDGLNALHAKAQGDIARHDALMNMAVSKLNFEHKRYHPDSMMPTPFQLFIDHPTENLL